ncbi:MAG: hypothetical protein ACUVQZ_09405 [Candidatus Caldatribacteriaceae bacterium]
MEKKKVLLVLSVILFIMYSFSTGWTKVSVKVLQDVYVLPVAELASTKTHPEIVRIENDIIEITIVPNRGRILSSYLLKGKEPIPLIYCNFVPKPMVLPAGLHIVEFGGYYLSLPWNDRDRQPFDLSFVLTCEEENFAEIFLSGKDMFKKTLTECWVRVKENSPVVEIEARITNLSKRETRILPFKDFVVVDAKSGCLLALPTETIKVIESRGGWLGEPGKTVNWPTTFTDWDGMKDYLRFKTGDSLALPCVAVMYPDKGAAFIKWWEPEGFFSGLEVWSWGQSWVKEPGADAYVVISSIQDDLVLEPQEQVSFRVYFAVLKDVSKETPLQELVNRLKLLVR